MNHKVLVTVFLLTISFNKLKAQNNLTVRIDNRETYGGMASEYFDHIEYIPLETTKKSTFGEPSWLYITDSSFVIGDIDTWSLLFFDLKGKFLAKHPMPISYKTKNYWLDINIDVNMKTVIMSSTPSTEKAKSEWFYFSFRGVLKDEQTVLFDPEKPRHLHKLDENHDLYATYKSIRVKESTQHGNISLLQVFDKKDAVYRDIFSTSPKENPFLFAFSRGKIDVNTPSDNGSLLFVVPFDYTLFQLEKNTVTPVGKFIFPLKNIIPKKDFESKPEKYLDSLQRAKNMDINLVQTVRKIDFHNNTMIFNIQKRIALQPDEGSIIDPLNFMFDTLSKKLSSFERITPDIKSNYLPFMDGFSSTSGMNYKNGYVYTSVASLYMFAAYEKNKSRKPQYPPILQQYFKTQNRKSNPVIVRMKLKE